jgi:hypothetical protein
LIVKRAMAVSSQVAVGGLSAIQAAKASGV